MTISLDEFADHIKALKNQYRYEGSVILNSALKQYFIDHPVATSIQFGGFVPYFNDGEPCTFGVMEYLTKVNDYGEDDWYDVRYDRKPETPEYLAYSELVDIIHKIPSEIFEDIFGSHFLATATPDKIEVEEYTDHD